MERRRIGIGGWCGAAVALALVLVPARSTRAEDKADVGGTLEDKAYVGGTVADAAGDPVAGVVLELLDERGEVAARATTGESGGYELPCVATGAYRLRLDPSGTGLVGDTVAATVGAEGLVVNWTVERGAPPLAVAVAAGVPCVQTIGAAPPAPEGAAASKVPPAAVVVGAGAVVVGGTLGGLAASGAFDGSDRSSATPSQ